MATNEPPKSATSMNITAILALGIGVAVSVWMLVEAVHPLLAICCGGISSVLALIVIAGLCGWSHLMSNLPGQNTPEDGRQTQKTQK